MTLPTSSPAIAPAPTRPRRRWLLLGLLLLLLGAAGIWWWFQPAPPVPPMPASIEEAEVQQVIEQARQEVLKRPRSAEAWGHFGKVLLAHLFDREADFCFAEAARLNPANPLWPYSRSLIALKREPDQALGLLRQAVAVADTWSSDGSAMHLQLAEALLERDDVEEAEQIFRAEFAANPANRRAAFGLGLIATMQGNKSAAEKLMMLAQSSPFARKKATSQLAALARSRGDHEAADTYEKQAAQMQGDPPWPDPLLDELVDMRVGRRGRQRLIANLENQGRFAEAAQIYLQQLGDQPSAENHIGAGINFVRLGDYEQAFPHLRKAVQLEPDNAHAHYSLALAFFVRAERQIHEKQDSPQLKEWFRKSIQHAQQATKLRPNHGRAYLFWGLSLKYLGDPEAAVAPLRKGVACSPANFDLQYALADVLLEVGRKQEAKTHLEAARQINPTDPRLAEALKRLGNQED